MEWHVYICYIFGYFLFVDNIFLCSSIYHFSHWTFLSYREKLTSYLFFKWIIFMVVLFTDYTT